MSAVMRQWSKDYDPVFQYMTRARKGLMDQVPPEVYICVNDYIVKNINEDRRADMATLGVLMGTWEGMKEYKRKYNEFSSQQPSDWKFQTAFIM